MKKFRLILSAVLIAALLLTVAVFPSGAVTLYTDGGYTFADIDEDYVALYAYDESSPALVVPNNYMDRYVSSIYEYAFEDNKTISSIDFSQARKLDTIGLKAFASCANLSGTLTLPNSVRTIGLGAFERCTSLTEVVVNSSVEVIPQQCFNRCSSLSQVYLSPSVERIENLAFANCGYLDDVYLTTSVNYISNTAFLNSNFVRFHVWYGSYAYNYARDNHIPYTLLDGVKLGDVNGDGNITIDDATQIQRHLAQFESLEGIYLYAADANGDGVVDIDDATAIQLYLAQYEIPYHIGEVITQ